MSLQGIYESSRAPTMADSRRTLPPSLVDAAFPFHLVLDRQLRIVQVGASIQRLHATNLVGVALGELFDITTPKAVISFDSIIAMSRSLFLLRSCSQPGLLLRGQMLHDPDSDSVFFVGSPWVTETEAFASLGLTLGDFAVSDPVVDYVLLLQNQTQSLVESQELATRLHESAERLAHQAFTDSLTGLPNRASLVTHLRQVMDSRPASAAHAVAVLMLDLDGFKAVNDSYGHPAGDDVLEIVGSRLRAVTREGDVAARFGGDEFAILLTSGTEGAQALPALTHRRVSNLARRVLATLSKPIPLPSSPAISVELSASIGIAYRTGAETADDLLRNADLAMYSAKAAGKSRFEQYIPQMHTETLSRLDLATQLRHAIDGGQLRLHYQPILRLDGDRFAGAEALLRWQHPTRGLLGPQEFLEIAEDTGLIVQIGAWVLNEACRELRIWQDAYTGAQALGVAVNLSGRQFGPDLVTTVASTLETHDLDPGCLTLEVTEGLIAGDGPAARQTLRRLKNIGVWLAIDDFGTGHSSLGRLRDYDFDELKIDRRFVSDLDTGDPTLVASQIGLAHGLGMGVVAEGVETPGQLAYLREAGCAQVQGYLIARPLPPAEVRGLLAGRGEWLGQDTAFPRAAARAAS